MYKNKFDQEKATDLFWWMCDGAQPTADGRKIIAEICTRLNDLGVPVDRFALFIFTIHPTIKGKRLSWTPQDGVSIVDAGINLLETEEYKNNPLPMVARTQTPLRLNLSDPDITDEYIIVEELRKDDFTDYLCQPLVYIDGDVHTVSWSTKHSEGFGEQAIKTLENIRLPLARITESYVLRLNAAYMMSTYVGRNAGDQVLSGKIKQGDGEDISAVILFADLANFTRLSNEQSSESTLTMLNRFFTALEKPIRENGGEILKFMGDGLLAIFQIDDESSEQTTVVRRAFSALQEAENTLNSDKEHPTEFRAALHLGELHYGNIGGEYRLDFTAIGPSVNLTARLLSHASNMGTKYVCSKIIANHLLKNVGKPEKFKPKGFEKPHQIFPLQLET